MSDYVAWAGLIIAIIAGAAAVVSARHAKRSADVANKALLSSVRPLIVPTPVISELVNPIHESETRREYHSTGRTIEFTGDAVIRVNAGHCMYSVYVQNAGSGVSVFHGARLLERTTAEPVPSCVLAGLLPRVASAGDSARVVFVDNEASTDDRCHSAVTFDILYRNVDGSQWFRSLIDVSKPEDVGLTRVDNTRFETMKEPPFDMGSYQWR